MCRLGVSVLGNSKRTIRSSIRRRSSPDGGGRVGGGQMKSAADFTDGLLELFDAEEETRERHQLGVGG